MDGLLLAMATTMAVLLGNLGVNQAYQIAVVGKYSDSTYTLVNEPMGWSEAREVCQSEGGDLAVMETDGEWEFLFGASKKVDAGNQWLGAAGDGRHRNWKWITGLPLRSDPRGIGAWKSGMPMESGRSCLLSGWKISPGDNWYDYPCHSKFPFLCETKA